MDHVTREDISDTVTLFTYRDPDPESPRNWDNLGTVVLLDRCRYAFGDEKMGRDAIQQLLDDKRFFALPVYIYDHSGITINTTGFSCPWDSGLIGVIYCSLDAVREWYVVKRITDKIRARALDTLRAEIAVLDQYLTGDVYGFAVHVNGKEAESCWGFYGEDEALGEGRAVAKNLLTAAAAAV